MIYKVRKITPRQDLDDGLTERCWTKPGVDAAFGPLGMNMSWLLAGYVVCLLGGGGGGGGERVEGGFLKRGNNLEPLER